MEYAINIKNLTKHYNNFSLDGVSFQLPAGCIMGFIGANGAGKTTTIKALLNLIHIDGGSCEVLGKNSSELNPEDMADIGVVFAGTNFSEQLKTKEIRTMMKGYYGSRWEDEKFLAFQKRFRLEDEKKIKEYSRGMQMKLSIAIAMSHQARLLILDEATSGLDPVSRDGILDLFMEFIQDEAHSILISSHITSDLEKIADYITLIHEGRILLSEEANELLYRYGVIRCREDQLDQLKQASVCRVRKSRFGCEVLIDNREEAQRAAGGDYPVDRTNIEEIMLFMAKGEEQ